MTGLPIKRPLIARPKAIPPSEQVIEAGDTLRLGSAQDLDTLTVSEASLIINAVMAKRRQAPENLRYNPILQNTLNYCDAFARYRTRESIEAVERLLSAYPELAKSERAQLGSFCCRDADEAKTVIPSPVDKVDDEKLQELLDELVKLAV
ncbi:hypothetical protein LMH87_004989 [Akanthomyces muscarius]|uniref:RNA polymerase Rpb4/RPC9 core domain-containing protein n=1 Tax=Akanthomyces muscarius TaxID=2231603 RepID=A0A9W8QJT9_AKAMU|nr:hypothetical protein LMH87_004989 [Akanthomyces muscarius]KAJ4163248.1 hypothetical protein LMH87_004989 [Akanthomyces muscarius]